MRHLDVPKLWRVLGWAGVGFTLVVSLMPPPLGSDEGQLDKIAHLAGYAVLMFWWAQLIVRQRWRLALAVVAFGIAIELLQGLTPERLPDPLDALANTLGMLLGWSAARLVPNLPARLVPLFAPRR